MAMDAIVEIEPNDHLIINVSPQARYIKQYYQHPINQIGNISVLQKLHSKIVSETRHKIFTTKSMLTAMNFLNTCGNWKTKKITSDIKWNIISIVHGTPKGGVCKLCFTKKFWLLKHFSNEHLLNTKSGFISKCRHENKLLVKSAEKG